MKKKLLSIVLSTLVLSLTACGSSSDSTSQNVAQEEVVSEVAEQNLNEAQDTKESQETVSGGEETVREEDSKESDTEAELITDEETEADKETASDDKETISNDEIETTTVVEETTTNTDSDKTETTTEIPVSNETAPAQSQTFNVNIKYDGGQVWVYNPDDGTINPVTMPPVDFGNFQLVLNGDIHVASGLDGWAEYNTMTEYDGVSPSYEFYILVPLDAQDANKTFDFELICPDNTAYNIRTATVRNSIDECAQYVDFTYNNGTIKGTATAKGQNIWICFNVKF